MAFDFHVHLDVNRVSVHAMLESIVMLLIAELNYVARFDWNVRTAVLSNDGMSLKHKQFDDITTRYWQDVYIYCFTLIIIIRNVRVAHVPAIAMETLDPINELAVQFLNDQGHSITSVSADDKEEQFLFRRLSVALQRFNAILLHKSFGSDDDPDI